jgi:hypothetical protein
LCCNTIQGIQEIKEPLEGPGSEQEFLNQSTSRGPVQGAFDEPVDPAEVQRISSALERLELLEQMGSSEPKPPTTNAKETKFPKSILKNTVLRDSGAATGAEAASAFCGVVQERPTSGFGQDETQLQDGQEAAQPPSRQSRFKQQQMAKRDQKTHGCNA